MSDKRLTYEGLAEDERRLLRIYNSLDRPHQRAMALLMDLFNEHPADESRIRWIIQELQSTAAALRELADQFRADEQQAARERRQRLQVIKGGNGND